MKKHKATPEDVLADLIFMLEQSHIIEHKQDYAKICELRRKYKVSI